MQCTKPVWLEFYKISVPCGKCINCRIGHSREWSIRLLHELDNFNGEGIFTTLTYNDENLPQNNSINKRDLQLFFKRLRRDLEPRKIKYFAAGEYGEKEGRPHYHAIILGIKYNESRVIGENWPFGYVHTGTVTYDSCRYCADYIFKKLTGEKALNLLLQKKELPFQLCSQGIGKNYAIKNSEQIRENLGITLNGKNVGIPRYYKKVLELGADELGEKASLANEELNDKLANKCNDDYAKEALLAASRRQRDLNTKARLNLKKDSIKKDTL